MAVGKSLSEALGAKIETKDKNKNEAKGSKNHLERTKLVAGARTKSVCYKVNPDMYDKFQTIVVARGQKANALINQWITEYVNQNEEKWLN